MHGYSSVCIEICVIICNLIVIGSSRTFIYALPI